MSPARSQNLPLYIDDTGGISIAQLAARARRLKRQKGLDLLVVDYLQLLSGSSQRANENRVQELTEITTTLKALAKELDVPIIALSQLSRQVENRDDKHPQLSDLRESGSIEQDADVVMFVYREEYYLKNKEPSEDTEEHWQWQGEMEKVHGKAEVIIGKQRHGPTGTVQLSSRRSSRASATSRAEDACRSGGNDGDAAALDSARRACVTAAERAALLSHHRSRRARRATGRTLRDVSAPAECGAVVKADAYGIGIGRRSRRCWRGPAARPSSSPRSDEGMQLRALLPDAIIYVFNGLLAGSAEAYRRPRPSPRAQHASRRSRRGPRSAQRRGRDCRRRIHIDSGMNRLGLSAGGGRGARRGVRSPRRLRACARHEPSRLRRRPRSPEERIAAP